MEELQPPVRGSGTEEEQGSTWNMLSGFGGCVLFVENERGESLVMQPQKFAGEYQASEVPSVEAWWAKWPSVFLPGRPGSLGTRMQQAGGLDDSEKWPRDLPLGTPRNFS